MTAAVLSARSVCSSLAGHLRLNGLDLELHRGDGLALLGDPAGETRSLFRLVLGIEQPDSGTVRVCGLDPVRESRLALQRVCFLPAEPDAPLWMRPRDYFAHVALHYPNWDEDVTEDHCETWGIPQTVRLEHMERDHVLRVQLLANLACEPDLLLLDGSFVDSSTGDTTCRETVIETLAEFRSNGGAIVYSAGDSAAVAELATRTAAWVDGRISEATRNDAD